MRHVIFRVEKERYALPLSAVREVVVPPALFSRVPRAPAGVHGVINLRGRVVTVVEMRALLGLEDTSSVMSRVVLLDRGRRDVGLLVNDVDGIEMIERVNPPPEQRKSGNVANAPQIAVRGLARLKGLAVTVLDPEGVDAAVTALFNPNR